MSFQNLNQNFIGFGNYSNSRKGGFLPFFHALFAYNSGKTQKKLNQITSHERPYQYLSESLLILFEN